MPSTVIVPLPYRDLKEWIRVGLAAVGFTPDFHPGPVTVPDVTDKVPGQLVVLTRGSGAPLAAEGMIDRPVFAVNCLGDQTNYDDAENLAFATDSLLIHIDSNQQVGDTLVYGCERTGGPPAVVGWDDAERWWLSCSYIFRVQSGV